MCLEEKYVVFTHLFADMVLGKLVVEDDRALKLQHRFSINFFYLYAVAFIQCYSLIHTCNSAVLAWQACVYAHCGSKEAPLIRSHLLDLLFEEPINLHNTPLSAGYLYGTCRILYLLFSECLICSPSQTACQLFCNWNMA